MTSPLSQRFVNSAIFLLLLNLLTGNIGAFSKELNSLIGSFLLIVFFLLNLPVSLKRTTRIVYFTAFSLSILWLIQLKLSNIEYLMVLLVSLVMLLHLWSSMGQKSPGLLTLLVCGVLYSTFIFLYEHSTLTWYLVQHLSGYISIVVSMILDYSIDYSTTYTGFLITLSFIFLFFSHSLVGNKINFLSLFKIISIAAFIQVGYLLLHSFLMKFSFFVNGLGGRAAVDFHFIFFFFMLFPLYQHLKTEHHEAAFHGLPTRWIFPILILAIAGIGFRLVMMKDHGSYPLDGKVVFFNEGHADWNVPVFGNYGGENGGMFGMLIRDLKSQNVEVSVSAIDKDTLSNTNILVLINLNRPFSAIEKNLIWNFVYRGGSLLVLGDHTGKEVIRYPFNDLLSPFGIQFNFDSAISRIKNWENGFHLRHHYINRQIEDENDVQIWIGASLSVKYPAKPVITGKDAFSDLGNPAAALRGYLGDMRYNHGEKLGNIVLVAEAPYGKGTVLVFGDTSSFQNSTLALSSSFVKDIFVWLFNYNQYKHYGIFPFIDCLFLLSLLFFSSLKFWTRSNVFAFLSISPIMFFLIGLNTIKNDQRDFLTNKNLALINASHIERFSLDLWGQPNGLGGLVYNLARNGFSVVIAREFNKQHLCIAELLVIIAPAKPFSHGEIEFITNWINNGGKLIISVSWPDKNGALPLLEALDLDIGNTPLGRVMPIQNEQGLVFDNAWPVVFNEKKGMKLCEVWGYPTIGFIRYGKGAILLVGDSSFLLNKNIEGLHHYFESNVIFLKDVIASHFKYSNKGEN